VTRFVAAGTVASFVGVWISVGGLSCFAPGVQAENKTTAARQAINFRAVVDLNLDGVNSANMVRNYIRPPLISINIGADDCDVILNSFKDYNLMSYRYNLIYGYYSWNSSTW
jgi:hypothetical protein